MIKTILYEGTMANIFGKKHAEDQGMALETAKGPLQSPKVSWI